MSGQVWAGANTLLDGGTADHMCPAELASLLDSTVAAVTLRAAVSRAHAMRPSALAAGASVRAL